MESSVMLGSISFFLYNRTSAVAVCAHGGSVEI